MNVCDSPIRDKIRPKPDKVQVGLYNQPRQKPLTISLRLLTQTTRGLNTCSEYRRLAKCCGRGHAQLHTAQC